MASVGDEENVLYGGPDCEVVEPDAQSLGEVAQRMLVSWGDRDIIVRALPASGYHI